MARIVIVYSHLLILLTLSIQLSAQTAITLKEAYRIGLDNNIALKRQQVSIEQADLDRSIHQTYYLPEAELSAGFNHISELARLELPLPLSNSIGSIAAGVNNQYNFSLQVAQPVFTGLRTRNIVKASEAQIEAQRIAENAIENDLLLQIGMMYYQIQENLLNQEVLTATIERIDRRLQQVKSFYSTGQVAPFDTLESANRKLQQETQLKSLRFAEQILLKQFKNLLNTKDEIVVVLEDEEFLAVAGGSLQLDNTGESRAEIKQLAHLISAQKYSSDAMRSTFFPQVYAVASFQYARPGVNFFRDKWMDYYTFGINLRWNLWNWGRDHHKIKQSELEVRQLELQQQQLRQVIDTEVTTAYQNLQAAKSLAEAQHHLVDREAERYRISEEKFGQSQISVIDLNDAEKDLTIATLLLKQYVIQVKIWQLKLYHATGRLSQLAAT